MQIKKIKRKQKSKTQIKKENGSAKQNGSKQEKRPCFAVVPEQSLNKVSTKLSPVERG